MFWFVEDNKIISDIVVYNYGSGMESTLSEHHQQNAKNFNVTFERRNGINFDVISCIYFHKTPLNIITSYFMLPLLSTVTSQFMTLFEALRQS
jgi:hypothetical protein